MKASKIDKAKLEQLLKTLTADQKKLLSEGIEHLDKVDPASIAKLLDGGKQVAVCDCGPSGEPGLGRW